MSVKSFLIKKKDGKNFAKLSGDNNRIHINEIEGHNSIYGHNIAHGALLILRFIKKINLKKNFSYIKILFNDGIKYENKIRIKKIKKDKKKILYALIQNNNVIVKIEIGLHPLIYQIQDLKKNTIRKKFILARKNKNFIEELNRALCSLSKYVGTIFPGKDSLISEVNITLTNFDFGNNVLISSDSTLLKKGFPVIENRLKYKNYNIQFKTLIRPKLYIKLKKPQKKILKQINLIKENVLIVGASSGIGNDLLKLFLKNKKIKIIGTYFKNKILIKNKNLIKKKINIEKNLSKIFDLIKKNNPIIIYYFPTPKILFKKIHDKNLIKLYTEYFINTPIKIIRFSNRYNCKFFYPSTTYKNNSSPYSLIKLKAEKELNKLKKNKTIVNVAKISGINTKQNLSLIHRKFPDFRELISSDKQLFNKVFFIK